MATNDIKYTLNGQLTDNTVTKDDKNDKILTLVSAGKADQQRIISEIMALNPGMERETVEAIINLEHRVVQKLVLSGFHVTTGLYQAVAQCTGIIENKTWNPETNTVYASFIQGADMREAIRQTHINIIGEKSNVMYVAGTQDVSTRATDTSATAGRNFTVTGSLLKVVGTDPTVGITLTNSSGVVTKVPEDMWAVNDPSKLTFIIPAGLTKGEYTLTLTTQYSGNSKIMLKTPRSVTQTIYIGQAPTGGGGEPNPDDNPLG
ncbi:DUF4469 domain-containing protein [Bacteroides sp.]|uniref:DUF4469 domain-containing protein n=1 Tax=Bacteroides sp. TaxID=29523 RepID=UPI00261BA161|nr:DUF4469 domain-containing protein [Bacteroides sp.]